MNKFAAEQNAIVEAMSKIASANGLPLTYPVAQRIAELHQYSPVLIMKTAALTEAERKHYMQKLKKYSRLSDAEKAEILEALSTGINPVAAPPDAGFWHRLTNWRRRYDQQSKHDAINALLRYHSGEPLEPEHFEALGSAGLGEYGFIREQDHIPDYYIDDILNRYDVKHLWPLAERRKKQLGASNPYRTAVGAAGAALGGLSVGIGALL